MSSEIAVRDPKAPLTFNWDERRETAAALVAQGELSVNEIAARVGVDRDTLWTWKKSPVFNARIAQHLAVFRDELLRVGVASKVNRIAALQDRHLRLLRVIEERGEAARGDPEAENIPGAASGLLVRQVRVTGSGRSAERVVEWVLDAATLREIRAVEEHIAKELGDWQPAFALNVDNTIVSYPDGSFSMGQKMYQNIDLDRV